MTDSIGNDGHGTRGQDVRGVKSSISYTRQFRCLRRERRWLRLRIGESRNLVCGVVSFQSKSMSNVGFTVQPDSS